MSDQKKLQEYQEMLESAKQHLAQVRYEENIDEWMHQAGRVEHLEREIAKIRKAQLAEAHDAEMRAAGYEQQTTTEWEENWDGEGGQYVTRTEWVKVSDPITAEPMYDTPIGPEPKAKSKIVEISEYEGTWDAQVEINGNLESALEFITEADARNWANTMINPIPTVTIWTNYCNYITAEWGI